MDVRDDVFMHSLLWIYSFDVAIILIVWITNPKVDPAVRNRFEILYFLSGYGGVSWAVVHRTFELSPLQLFIVIKQIDLCPPISLSSTNVVLNPLRKW